VLESSGRLFCGSCRRYLDSAVGVESKVKETPTPTRVGAPHLPRCVAASLPDSGDDVRSHPDDYDCECPCHVGAGQLLSTRLA
jgi:hypothetical protein